MSKLYIVPTPLGNLRDITFRAIEVLKMVDFILAEDTRNTGKLLKFYDIENTLVSYHQHNEHAKTPQLIERIKGKNAALVSDAGTPGISDAGYLLVRSCISAGIEVETLPGATAFVPALVNSGFPCDKFYFHGFLPHKKGKLSQIAFLKTLPFTSVLYESPHRLMKTLEMICEVFGQEQQISISREISKIHEETIRGEVGDVLKKLENKTIYGEIVIVIGKQ